VHKSNDEHTPQTISMAIASFFKSPGIHATNMPVNWGRLCLLYSGH